ncbi:MAG: hypothetical protein IPF57_14350 [Gammaproteobacteria bacterium]|nr:hypothetical protein [Gammaproteobacteria bacterium]
MDEEEQRGSTEIAIPKWLPTFADMMTLLMCFFVLLLTFAEMDIKRYEQIAGSMSEAFGVQRRIVAESVPMGTSVIALEFSPGVPRPTPISERYQQDDALPEPAPDAAADEATPDLELTEQMKRNVEAQIRATQADAAAPRSSPPRSPAARSRSRPAGAVSWCESASAVPSPRVPRNSNRSTRP